MKYFELVAEPVTRELLPGLYIKGWGYNGSIPGPTIQVYPGDYINIRVYNRLPEATSIHWHGLDVPNVMDYVTAADGNSIPVNNRLLKSTILAASGETWDVEFKADNPGIWPFHCHIPQHMSNNLTNPTGGMFTTIAYRD